MTDDENRIKALGAKVELLADLKRRAEQRLEAADEEITRLRAAVDGHRTGVPLEQVWTLDQVRAMEWQKDQRGGLIEVQYEDLLWLVTTFEKVRDCNERLWHAVKKEANK